jgi:hypothetical protein
LFFSEQFKSDKPTLPARFAIQELRTDVWIAACLANAPAYHPFIKASSLQSASAGRSASIVFMITFLLANQIANFEALFRAFRTFRAFVIQRFHYPP